MSKVVETLFCFTLDTQPKYLCCGNTMACWRQLKTHLFSRPTVFTATDHTTGQCMRFVGLIDFIKSTIS